MDDSEKHLSVYQHQHCLNLISHDSCDENIENYKDTIPKLIEKSNKINSYKTEVNKFFDKYLEEQMSAKDYRLLKGVFSNQDLSNEELRIIMPQRNDSEDEIDMISIASIDPIPNSG